MAAGQKSVALQDSGFVLKVGDTFRMYHHERVMGKYSDHGGVPRIHVTTPYLESKDGIHWVKPDPGLWKWKREGQQKDDLVSTHDIRDYYPELVVWAMFIDPTAKHPKEKFKMALTIKPPTGKAKRRGRLPKGKYGFCSPDGIHWKMKSPKKFGTSGEDPKELPKTSSRSLWPHAASTVPNLTKFEIGSFGSWVMCLVLSYLPDIHIQGGIAWGTRLTVEILERQLQI